MKSLRILIVPTGFPFRYGPYVIIMTIVCQSLTVTAAYHNIDCFHRYNPLRAGQSVSWTNRVLSLSHHPSAYLRNDSGIRTYRYVQWSNLYSNAPYSRIRPLHPRLLHIWIFHATMPFENCCIPLKHKILRLQGQKIAIGIKSLCHIPLLLIL